MKAIFWKEIRENLKWGAIGFVVFSLALLRAWSIVTNPNNNGDFESVLSPVVLIATTLCAPVFAAALGFLQILPEQRRDRWAFLVHRPVQWTTIFWGKVAAGLVFYFVATLIPWVCLCWWASIPGHIGAPFHWKMSLGGLADILAASAFYFAGMITSLRQARWLGSKALALTGALWVLFAAEDSVHFLGALGWMALMVGILAISARENFARNGVYTTQSVPGRLALMMMFTLGLCLLVGWVFNFSGDLIRPKIVFGEGSNYEVTKDGEAVRVFSVGAGPTTKVEDANGNVLPLSKEELVRYMHDDTSTSRDLELRDQDSLLSYRSPFSYLVVTSTEPGNFWLYDRASRRLETYDRYSRNLKGYLTPDGYHPASEGVPSSTFPESEPHFAYSTTSLMVFEPQSFVIDYDNLSACLINGTQNTADFKGAAYLPASEENDPPVALSLVAMGLKEGITFYKGSDGSPLCRVPYEQDTRTYPIIEVGRTKDGLHLFTLYLGDPELRKASGYKMPLYLYRYSMTGILEKKWELPSILQPQPGPLWTTHIGAAGTSMGQQVYNAVYTWVWKQAGDPLSIQVWHDRYLKNWPEERKDWMASAIAGLVCAVVTFLRAKSRQLQGREIVMWLVFVFFGGIAGLLVFLSVKEWPLRIACSNCGNPRAIDRDLCLHCAAPWEAPKRDGTEIFA